MDQLKVNFFRAFNSIVYRSKNAISELVSVNLLNIIVSQFYCIAAKLRSCEAAKLSHTDTKRFDNCLNFGL